MPNDFIVEIIEDIGRGNAQSIEGYLKTVVHAFSLDGTQTKFYTHMIELNGNGQVRLDDFIEFIVQHIVEYVIPRSRILEAKTKDVNEGGSRHIVRLAREAQKLFTPLKKTGEGGEMLLFVLGEVLLQLPQLFCKMSVKTSAGVHYHGADGVHVGFGADNKLELYWGESKLHKSFEGALTDCIKSIGPILKRLDDADLEDLLLLQTHLDLSNPAHTQAIKTLLDKDSPDFNLVKYCGLCLIGFDENLYTSEITDELIESKCTKWKASIATKLTNAELQEFNVHFFCIPFVSVEDFRKRFLEKLGLTTSESTPKTKPKAKAAPQTKAKAKKGEAMTQEEQLLQWILDQSAFQVQYENLLLASVSCQFSAFDNKTYTHDWNYLLKCASFLAHSQKAQLHDIALRIAQYTLQSKDSTTDSQKNSAQFVLNKLANRRSIDLAKDRNLLQENADEWREGFYGNLNWVKQEIDHSVWLKSGERLDVNVFQKSFWEALDNYQTLSISAPTSAGKSHLIKQWILEKIFESRQTFIVYVVPTRALIAEVEADFQNALSTEIQASLVNVTSFPFIKFSDESKPCVYILTQERLQLLLERNEKEIDILIVDEAYKLADDDRGILLQHVIEKTISASSDVKVIYISPLASNPEILIDAADPRAHSARFEDVTVNQNLIWATQKRGAKWELVLCYNDKKLALGDILLSGTPSSVSLRLPMIAYALGQSGGSIVYVNGAADAEKAAQQLCDMIGFDNQRSDQALLDLIDLCRKVIHKDYRLIEALKYGVAFHYGNMPLLIRDEIESLFKAGIIQFLVCTSTLVEGVNLPCRNIFIRSPKRGNDTNMNVADFWNLAGRAGRWGKDFQGNIICVDPALWEAPEKKSLTKISRAAEVALEQQGELVDFIRNGTPRASASSHRTLESMASYLAINYKTLGSIHNIQWMQRVEPLKVLQLEAVVSEYLNIDTVPDEIIKAHPGISPLAMAEMIKYFEDYERSNKGKSFENLMTPYASDSDAVSGYVAILKRLYERLTNEFGNNDGYIFREAIVIVHWMQGRPIKRIIEERKKVAPATETIHTTIRTVLKDIESIARYKAPKYISCYNDLLKSFFVKIGKTDLASQIEDITLFLEMGVNTPTHLSLMNLGLSRTSAVEIKEFITADSLSEKQCLDWLTNPRNNWRSRDLPEIVKREVDKILKIYIAHSVQ